MPFFNRPHAAQGFEILATICGLFAFLATTEALATSGASERPVALLIAGTAALSAGAGLTAKKARIAASAFLGGPFIACVLLAIVVPLREPSVGAYVGNPVAISAAFAVAASVLFVALRALRAP